MNPATLSPDLNFSFALLITTAVATLAIGLFISNGGTYLSSPLTAGQNLLWR